MKASKMFAKMSTDALADWYFQYGQPRQAGFYRTAPRRAAVKVLLDRLGSIPKDPRVIVIARGDRPGRYTWETTFPV